MSASAGPVQEHRRVAIASAFGENVLLFHRMTATEHMGRLFQFEIEVVSTEASLKPKDILGTNVTVRLETGADEPRYFNGFATRFSAAGRTGNYTVYQLSLRPWLWFLTRTADCRIFQHETTPVIVKKIFNDLGFSDFDTSGIKGSHPEWEYCVQYRETDFNFVSRLMEQAGIYYWFKHENGKHTVMLTDDVSTHEPCTGYEQVHYSTDSAEDIVDHMTDWQWSQQVQPGNYAMQDWNFETLDNLMVKKSLFGEHPHAKYEIYDYPGEYKDTGAGENYAQARIEELFSQHDIARGAGHARGLYVGGIFKLSGYWREDQNKEWLVISATHEVVSDEYASSGGAESDRLYSGSLTVIPATVQYRSPRVTPKPVVQGPQTAIVVGKSGEEIWPDKHGRVLVQFHWDREGKADESSSCWIRVATKWAGKEWGQIHIPRIGHEVIVDFLEGDPDRPIIVGEVYNGDNKPPYGLPDNKTISGLKSNSTKGGGGFNEFRFEDKKGEEQIFLHAEKDQDIRVKATRKETIGGDRHLHVVGDKFEHVEGDRHEIIDLNHLEKITGTRNLIVETHDETYVTENRGVDVGGDSIHHVAGKHYLTVDGNISIESTGGNIVLEAANNITLRAGGSVISIDSGGIKLETGADILATGMNITTEANADNTVTGAMATVEGSASVTISGGVVQIN